ncbi:MAG: hypothetical protein H5T61_02960 [Thermoflexales bacterium]|nr:hypothetical protein [Thermoflexales bacterium]
MAGRKSSPGWLHRIGRWYQDWFRRIQRWYWHLADEWLFLALWRFFKALFILLLWVLGAIGLFYLMRYLLPDTLKIPLVGEGKESIAFLGSLLSALIGFGLQQWKGHEEEERRQREEETRAICGIEEEFPDLLRRDLSEGARRYVKFRQMGGIWRHGRIRARLEEVWERGSPPELRCAVALLEKFPEAKDFAPTEECASLLWVYNHLDEDWRSRVADKLLNLGGSLPEWTEKKWRAIVGIWSEVTLGKDLSAPDRWVIRGLRYLGLSVNLFGPERAEVDAHLLKARVHPSWWEKIALSSSEIFVTVPGGGRTAAALLLAYDVLDRQTAFPVYCRVAALPLSLDNLARWTAQAIARYVALSPSALTKCPYSARQAIKRLLSGYLPVDPLIYLQEAGLSSAGEGGKVQEEFKAYPAGLSKSTLSQADLLRLLDEARPADFPRTLVLLDVQGIMETEDAILSFYAFKDVLVQTGVSFQVFVAASPATSLWKYGESLEWSDEDLRALLQRRLGRLTSEETLDAWCDLRVWEGLAAEERLIAASGHSPRQLISLGNALLRRIGETGRRLTPEDLDEVLGPA